METANRPDAIEIEIDLRDIRAEAQREGSIPSHALHAAQLTTDIKSLMLQQPSYLNPLVSVEAMNEGGLPAKVDIPQVIDVIGIVLTALGAGGLTKLILGIVKACRTSLVTTIEVSGPGGKVLLSGPDIKPEDILKVLGDARIAAIAPTHTKKIKIRVLPKK